MADFKRILPILLVSIAFSTPSLQAQDFDGEETTADVKKVQEKKQLARDFDPSDFDPLTVKPKRLKKLAQRAFKLNDYLTVIDYLSVYMQENPDDAKNAWLLAESYRKARDYKNAEDWYNKIIALNQDSKFPKVKFYKAIMQKQAGFYDEAPDILASFRKSYKENDASQYKRLVKSETLGAEQAKSIISNPLKVVIRRLENDVNRETMESAPVLKDRNTLIYSSMVADVEDYFFIDGPDRPETKLFVAKAAGGGKWKKTDEFEGPFNKSGFHVPNGTFSQDGNRFYFTRCPKKITKKKKCQIYVSKYKDEQWREPELLNEVINMPGSNSTQPSVAVTLDKRTQKPVDVLYFVSDREKSRGGYDIWYSVHDSRVNDFRRARNVGPKVNSSGDDVTPFYNMQTGELFFSSNGHPNIGGFDVFKSAGSPKERFQVPENVGYPINSPADDISFTITKEGDMGFFASNRPGGNSAVNETCFDDVYQFVYSEYVKIAVEGFVFESENPDDEADDENYLDNADVALLLFEGSDTTLISQVTTGGNLPYNFPAQHGKKYLMKASKKGYVTRYLPLSTGDVLFSDTLKMNIGLKRTPPIILDIPVFNFATNKSKLSQIQENELNTKVVSALLEYPDLRLRISGHADDVGSNKYNTNLSRKRAKNIYKYLLSQGVAKEKIEYEAFGELKPLASKDTTGDIDSARAKNRRVEFEVIDNPAYQIGKTE